VLLIYPTAVIAIAAERGLDYSHLIRLATGAFVAFGLCSLPMGWLAERFGRRNMLGVFFLGYGGSCLLMTQAGSSWELAGGLLVLGIFSAIYHPIGSAMLVTHARRLGRDLGWNGVWGNLGAAAAAAVTAGLTAWFGWRVAFALPGAVCMLCGLAFLWAVRTDGDGGGPVAAHGKGGLPRAAASRPLVLLAVFAVAIVAGGMTFNVTTIAMPKLIDERIGLDLSLALTGSLATGVFMFGALMQLTIGRLLDRFPLPNIFVALAALQPLGLCVAALSTGIPLLLGLVVVTAAIYGQVVVNDAMVARYVPPEYRAKAYSVRYFLGFTASGFAAPLIAALHDHGGFPTVLGLTAVLGAAVFGCALTFRAASALPSATGAVAAE